MNKNNLKNKDDSCGCKLGAKFLLSSLPISVAYYVWKFYQSEITLFFLILKILLVMFVAAVIGKISGILIYRIKTGTKKARRFV